MPDREGVAFEGRFGESVFISPLQGKWSTARGEASLNETMFGKRVVVVE
jgi:hypothetical protein